MDWLQLAQERKEELIKELQQLIQIESVKDENNFSDIMPFGAGSESSIGIYASKRCGARDDYKKRGSYGRPY